MDFARLWLRFRRRKIATWTAAYVTAAGALFGTLETIGDVFAWGGGLLRATFFLLLAGLAITVLVAWFHGEKGKQGVGLLEGALLGAIALIGFSLAGWSLREARRVEAIREADAAAVVDGSTGGAEGAEAADRPPHPEALEAYLRGEETLRQRTPAAVIQAIGAYREAAGMDSLLAAAPAREAYAYGLFVDWGWTYPGIASEDLLRRGLELNSRALEIDSVSPEGWLSRAYLLQLSLPDRPHEALPAFARAVSLDPTNPEAQHQYGQTLMAAGRYAEARAAYHAALAIDGDRPLTLVALSAIAKWTGDSSSFERWADSAVALADDAPYAWVSRALNTLDSGDFAQVASDAEQALRIDPSYEVPARSILAAALWHQGRRDRALEELARSRGALLNASEPGPTDALYLGAALVSMGRSEEALEVIESARPRARWLWFYLQSPAFDAVREDERFRRVVEEAAGPEVPAAARD